MYKKLKEHIWHSYSEQDYKAGFQLPLSTFFGVVGHNHNDFGLND